MEILFLILLVYALVVVVPIVAKLCRFIKQHDSRFY